MLSKDDSLDKSVAELKDVVNRESTVRKNQQKTSEEPVEELDELVS